MHSSVPNIKSVSDAMEFFSDLIEAGIIIYGLDWIDDCDLTTQQLLDAPIASKGVSLFDEGKGHKVKTIVIPFCVVRSNNWERISKAISILPDLRCIGIKGDDQSPLLECEVCRFKRCFSKLPNIHAFQCGRFPSLVDAIAHPNQLLMLGMKNCDVSHGTLASIVLMSNLRSLGFESCEFSHHSESTFRQFAKLRDLNVSGCSGLDIASVLANCPNLKSISFEPSDYGSSYLHELQMRFPNCDFVVS